MDLCSANVDLSFTAWEVFSIFIRNPHLWSNTIINKIKNFTHEARIMFVLNYLTHINNSNEVETRSR